MKTNTLTMLLFAMLLTMVSCSKEESQAPKVNTGNGNNIGSVPDVFTQKVLMELFTGAGQAQSTDGFAKLDEIMNDYSYAAIPVHIHFADAMEIAQYTTLTNLYANGTPVSIPGGMINRSPSLGNVILNRTQWRSNFDLARNTTAPCGLSIETTVNGSDAIVTVHCGFNQNFSGDYSVTTYLLEDDLTGTGNQYDQCNSYNLITGHPYAGKGDPIVNFMHQSVLRKVISNPFGDPIASTALVKNGRDTKSYTFSISAYRSNKLRVVAFITRNGASATNYMVMNVQVVKLGQTQGWD